MVVTKTLKCIEVSTVPFYEYADVATARSFNGNLKIPPQKLSPRLALTLLDLDTTSHSH